MSLSTVDGYTNFEILASDGHISNVAHCSYLPTHLQFFNNILALLSCCGNREHPQHHVFQYRDQLLQPFVVG